MSERGQNFFSWAINGVRSPRRYSEDVGNFNPGDYNFEALEHLLVPDLLFFTSAAGIAVALAIAFPPVGVPALLGFMHLSAGALATDAVSLFALKKGGDILYDVVQMTRTGFGRRTPRTVREAF